MSRPSFRTGLAATAAVLLSALVACDGDLPVDPSTDGAALDAARSPNASAARAAFMTRNLYLGAAVEPLLDPSLPDEQIPGVAFQLWQEVLATDFGARAAAIAGEIERRRPHAVGLQEVTLYRTQTPADLGATPATNVALDFQQELLDALAARGLDYEVASTVENVDAELPMLDPTSPTGLTDIRLTDYDMVLVRADVPWQNPASANYAVKLQVPPPPATPDLVVERGWASAEVRIDGTWYRFLSTHLEPFETGAAIQEAQAAELLGVLAGEELPVVAVGDFNADPGDAADTYDLLTETGGFTDTWDPKGDGLTCCQPADLANRRSLLQRRVDLILMRGDFGLGPPGFRGAVHAELFGNRTSDRTDSGLWPSDHAGVAAVIHLPQRD